MQIHYTFDSSSFPPMPGEDSELINEGTYGKALLDWYSKALRKKQIEAGEYIAEDFGWYAFLKVGSAKAGVACSVIHDSEAGTQECHLTIESCGLFARFRPSIMQRFEELVAATDEILQSSEEVRNIRIQK